MLLVTFKLFLITLEQWQCYRFSFDHLITSFKCIHKQAWYRNVEYIYETKLTIFLISCLKLLYLFCGIHRGHFSCLNLIHSVIKWQNNSKISTSPFYLMLCEKVSYSDRYISTILYRIMVISFVNWTLWFALTDIHMFHATLRNTEG